jgi:hypothetical protein
VIATAAALTVSGALLVGTTNVATALGEKATIVNLDLKAPKASPALTGTATAVDLTVSGALLVAGGTNVLSTLNLKAPIASPIFTGDLIIMETAVPGQIKHAFRQSGLSEIRTGLEVSGDIASNGTVWSQNEACLTGIQAYTKAEVNTALNLKAPLATPNFTGTATFNNVAIANQLLVGIVDVMSTLNNKAPNSNPSFLGTVTCESDTTIGGALTVSGARLNVASNITNSQLNGFSSLYFNNTSGASVSEVGQIFCGQSAGLNLLTTTSHPIKFTTYNGEVAGVPASMQILGSGTRAVEILAPLNIKSSQTTIDKNVTILGTLSVSGQSIVESLNPYWVAVVIGFSGGNPYFIRNAGRYLATSLIRMSGYATGIVQFDFPAHPQGVNYMHYFGGLSCFAAAVAPNKSSTRLGVVIRTDTATATVVDREVHVFISAY